MKLIRAIIRPDSTERVIEALEKKWHLCNDTVECYRARQGNGNYQVVCPISEMFMEMLMVVHPDDAVTKAVRVIETAARTGTKDYPAAGNPGDGRSL